MTEKIKDQYLSEIEYWKITEIANTEARDANDSRVIHEIDTSTVGRSLREVHSETLRDHDEIKSLILGGIWIVQKNMLSITGNAVDLGSGTGIGASILSNIPDIQKIFAVEYSEQFVQNMMPLVFSEFQTETGKIVRVVGDFNQLKLEDNSLSLILEIDSFHHSENISVTLNECYRVLKPGGVILSIDRAWPDSTSREELDAKLEIEYSDKQKKIFGIPEGQSYKRRDNGEHEYTISDWLNFYKSASFDAYVYSQVRLPKFNTLLIKLLPGFKLSLWFAWILGKLGFRRLPIYGFNQTRKLFIAIKH